MQPTTDLRALVADVKARHPIYDYAQRYSALKKKCRDKAGGYEYAGACPLCQGGEDRFVVWSGEGRALCRVCGFSGDVIALDQARAGGTFWDAVQRLGGQRPALPSAPYISTPPPVADGKKAPKARASATPRRVAEHIYRESDSTVLYRKDRWEPARSTPNRDKDFLCYHPDPANPAAWADGRGDDTPWVLYNWPAIYQAEAGALLCLVEGEGKADALTARGLLAGSADGPWRDDYARQVRGLDLVIFQDNDRHGADHTAKIAASCAGLAARIRVVAWPDKPAGYDVGDWLADGHAADELHALIAAAPEWQPGPAPDAPASARYKMLSLAEVIAQPPPTWIIDHVIATQAVSVLYGQWGIGKSFITLDWALSVATGRPWIDHQVQAGPVVYIAAEGAGGMGKRVQAWEHKTGQALPGPDRFIMVPEPVNLMDGATASAFVAALAVAGIEQPALIVFDTLSRCTLGGEENSNSEMSLAVARATEIAQATGAAVLLVHHPGKGGDIRGASAVPGNVETVIKVVNEEGVLKLECEKQKDGAAFDPFYLMLEYVESADSMVVMTASGAAMTGTREGALTPNMRRVLEALCSPSLTGGCKHGELLAGAGISHAETFRRINDALIKRGLMRVDPPMHEKSRERRYYPTEAGRALVAATYSHTHITSHATHSESPPYSHHITPPLGGVSESECDQGREDVSTPGRAPASPAQPNPRAPTTQQATVPCAHCGDQAPLAQRPGKTGLWRPCWDDMGRCSRAAARNGASAEAVPA